MAKADAEHRDTRIKAFQKFWTQAGGGRMSRPGRNADHLQLAAFGKIQHGGIVVPEHHGLPAQLIKRLHKVIGKGIVIIYEQKHGAHPPLPARDA